MRGSSRPPRCFVASTQTNQRREGDKSFDQLPRSRSDAIRRSHRMMSADADRLLGLQELWSEIINTFLEIACKRIESNSAASRWGGDALRVLACRVPRAEQNQGVESIYGIASAEVDRRVARPVARPAKKFSSPTRDAASRKVPFVAILLTACRNVGFFARWRHVTFAAAARGSSRPTMIFRRCDDPATTSSRCHGATAHSQAEQYCRRSEADCRACRRSIRRCGLTCRASPRAWPAAKSCGWRRCGGSRPSGRRV